MSTEQKSGRRRASRGAGAKPSGRDRLDTDPGRALTGHGPGLGAVGTMAAWSDSATATTGMFSTSSVQLKVDNQRPAHQFTELKRNSMPARPE